MGLFNWAAVSMETFPFCPAVASFQALWVGDIVILQSVPKEICPAWTPPRLDMARYAANIIFIFFSIG